MARAEKVVREQVSSEWAVRLRQEVDAAWQQSSLVNEAKLAKLEQLARENERVMEERIQLSSKRNFEAEASKLQRQMKAMQDRLATDLQEAKLEGRDEREAEMRSVSTFPITHLSPSLHPYQYPLLTHPTSNIPLTHPINPTPLPRTYRKAC